jgi:hypothetical protein
MMKITFPDVTISREVRVRATMSADGTIQASTITVSMEDFQANPDTWAAMQSETTTIMVAEKPHHYPLTMAEALARVTNGIPSRVVRVEFKEGSRRTIPSYRLHDSILDMSEIESLTRLNEAEHELVSKEICARIKTDLGVLSLDPRCSAAGLEKVEDLIDKAVTIWLSDED